MNDLEHMIQLLNFIFAHFSENFNYLLKLNSIFFIVFYKNFVFYFFL